MSHFFQMFPKPLPLLPSKLFAVHLPEIKDPRRHTASTLRNTLRISLKHAVCALQTRYGHSRNSVQVSLKTLRVPPTRFWYSQNTLQYPPNMVRVLSKNAAESLTYLVTKIREKNYTRMSKNLIFFCPWRALRVPSRLVAFTTPAPGGEGGGVEAHA